MGLRRIFAQAACVLVAGVAISCSPDVLVPRPTARAIQATAMTTTAACPPTAAAPHELVPHDAAAIVGVDLDALGKSAWFADLDAVAHAHPQLAPVLASIETCGVGPSDRRTLTIGLSAHDDAMVIVRATDLGTPATLDCIGRELKVAFGVSPWSRKTTGCTSVLEMVGGEGRGHALDADTVVLTSRGWMARVDERVAGRGRSALAGTLSWARGSVDMTRTVWFATQLSAEQAKTLGAKTAALRRLVGSLEMPAGLTVDLTAGFTRADEASDAARELDAELRSMGLAAPMFGLPASLLDAFTVTSRGTRLRVRGTISAGDLRALRRVLEGSGPSVTPPGEPSGI